ncbi:MAG TPA: TonB-dependent receptor, partial [Acidobacteriota bacterium]|nr:TonB-dependent receptor [Acidobacteriota bacterium]
MRLLKTFCAAVLVLASAALAFGQMIPTGQLVGTVTDNDKAPLPGVSVTISSPSLMLPQLATVTNENGLFRFFSLPSGTYKVTFELSGFRGVVREGIIISASRTVTLDIALEQGIEESITVTGKSPTVDLKMTQTGTTFTKALIDSLPLTRDLASIFNSAPGMFARTSHGSDARSNNFIVDGVKMQDPVTGDPYQTVPWNAIDEVEIETGSQKAEYGAVKGALVNVITKAGGNNFSGGVNFYYRSKSLQSDNTAGTPFEGQFVGFRHQYVPGFSLGGPVVKDKVWFFTSMDVDLSSSYVQGFPAPTTFGGPQPAAAPVGQKTYSPFGKVTWQLSEKDKLTASGYWRGFQW